jgi:hypothetical protein
VGCQLAGGTNLGQCPASPECQSGTGWEVAEEFENCSVVRLDV